MSEPISIPHCKDIDVFGAPGARCFVDVPIWLRVKDSPTPAFFSQPYEPNPGFVIVDHEVIVNDRLGSTSGPLVWNVQSGTATKTLQSAEEAKKELMDAVNTIEGKLQTPSTPQTSSTSDQKTQAILDALSDIKLHFDQELSASAKIQQEYSSNNAGLRIEAKAEAVKDWLGFYKSGGLIDAVVRIYQVYVGIPARIEATLQKHLGKVNAVAKAAGIIAPSHILSLSATADTYIRADADVRKDDNYGSERYMNVGTGRGSSVGGPGAADAMRALVRFDLSGISQSVAKGVLRLTVHSFGGSTSTPFRVGVYRVTQPWQEGNGAEACQVPGAMYPVPGATYPDNASGVAWDAINNKQAQPSFDPNPVAEVTIDPNTVKPGMLIDWDATPLVTSWIKAPQSNYGLMLRDVTTGGAFRELRFGTHEADHFRFPDGVPGPQLELQIQA